MLRYIINVDDCKDIKSFAKYIIDYIQKNILYLIEIDAKLDGAWQQYLDIVFPNSKLTLKKIILYYFDNLIFSINDDESQIVITSKDIELEDVKLENLIATIENGALDIRGYKIFQDIYNKIPINNLYKKWLKLTQG